MDKKQILLKKQYGDFNVVSQMLTKKLGRYISSANARRLIERENARHHKDALDALRQIVEARERVLQSV